MADYNLDLYQGSVFTARITARDSDGNTINLSGYTARGQVRYNYSSSGVLLDLQPYVNSGIGVLSGIVDVVVLPTGTAVVPPGKYPYDIEITNGPTGVVKLMRGQIVVYPEYTR